MAEDITSLQIKILYDSIEEAEKRLKKLEETGGKAKKGMKDQEGAAMSLMKTLGKLAATYLTVTTIWNQFRSAIQTTREFQVLRAQVQTATGSLENMEEAWGALMDFAIQTPYGIEDSVAAFVRLVNYGLTPSERAMRSYGDTASALGGSITDMAEAVAKATAGEFEPLRKYGITAKRTAEDVTFSFRGMKTTVKNNIDEIEKYFISIGENNFAGAMAARMETLDGRFANLEDAWRSFQYDLMTSTGAADAFGGVLAWLAEKVESLSDYINSGEMAEGLASWGVAFEGFAEAYTDIFDGFTNKSRETYDGFFTDSQSLWDDVKAYLQGVPVMFTALVEEISIRLWGIVDAIAAVGKQAYQQFAADLGALIGLAKAAGSAIAEALKGNFSGAWAGLKADADGIMAENQKATDKALNEYNNRRLARESTVAAELGDIWERAGQRLERQQNHRIEADRKAEAYAAESEKRAKDRSERLAKYRVATGGGADSPDAKKGKKGGGKSQEESEWETLEKSLRDQETLISESYARRFALIEKNTRDGSAYQAELEISLTEKFEEEQMRRIDAMKQQPEKMFQAFAEEEALIEETYARRKEIILNATELTESEKLRMLEEAETQYTAAMRKHETERNKVQLGLVSDFFGNISQIAGAFGKKGAKIAKAAAIAETTVKTYQAATSAYASLAGIPYVGPALGAAAAGAAIAAGLANIAKIKSTDDSGGYSGAYAIGGAIPAGKFGLVGEAGPELVRGPAMVTSAQSTWDRMGGARAGGGSNVDVKIINMTGEPVQETRRNTGDKETIEFIIGQAREAIANDISKGGTRVARAMEGTYNMTRGKRA